MFRRRRREDADQASSGYSGADAAGDTEGSWEGPDETGEWDDDAAEQGAVPPGAVSSGPVPPGLRGGPWDADEAYPERDRADFGSLLVPVTPMQQIELATDGQRFIWVTVKSGLSELRVHAFAAPRRPGGTGPDETAPGGTAPACSAASSSHSPVSSGPSQLPSVSPAASAPEYPELAWSASSRRRRRNTAHAPSSIPRRDSRDVLTGLPRDVAS